MNTGIDLRDLFLLQNHLHHLHHRCGFKASKKLHHIHHHLLHKRRFKASKKLNREDLVEHRISFASSFKEASMRILIRFSLTLNLQQFHLKLLHQLWHFQDPQTPLHPNSLSSWKKLTSFYRINKLRE